MGSRGKRYIAIKDYVGRVFVADIGLSSSGDSSNRTLSKKIMSLSILKNLWTCEKESDNGMELVVLVQADFIRVLALSGGKLCDCSAKIFMDQHLPRDKPSRTNKNPLGFPYTRIAQLW